MLIVYENDKIIYKDNKLDLIYLEDTIKSLEQIASHYYNDEIYFIETENFSISYLKSITNTKFIWVDKNRKDLISFYKLYSRARLFNDLNIFISKID